MYSQPGIYNVLDYGMSPSATGASNVAALQDAINAAQNANNKQGAIVLIPSFGETSTPQYGPYQMEIPSSGTAITITAAGYTDCPLLICGTGNGTTLEVLGSGTLFEVDNPNNAVTFQDLTITSGDTGGGTSVTAFKMYDGLGSSFFRVNVSDCQQAFLIQTDSTTLLQCTVTYDSAYSSTASCTGISIQARTHAVTEVNIEQCSLTCTNLNDFATGIDVGYIDYVRVCETQISGFSTGVLIHNTEGTSKGPAFAAVDIDATGSCVVIKESVYDASFVDCHFEPTATPSGPNASGIILTTTGGNNNDIDTVRFTSCTVSGFPAPYSGLEIETGQNIQVTGGNYSGNGGAGIAIVGSVTEIQITGANCIGLSYAGATTPTTQQYGIYVTAGQDIQIMGVNCSGNGISSKALGAGIYLDASESNTLVDVRISGAICCGPTLGGTATEQQYGIYASQVSGLLIDGCTLTNNTKYGAYLYAVENATVTSCDVYSSASGSKGIALVANDPQHAQYVFIRNCNGAQYGTNWTDVVNISGDQVFQPVEVTNCAGYNDVAPQLATVAPSGTFTAIDYEYYGPATFYVVTSSGTVKVASNDTGLTQGAFTLSPGETAEMTGTVTSFLMIGT